MIDLTSLKAPGWDKVVAELSAPAVDDRAYLERLGRVIGQVSAARQAAVFIAGTGGSAGELTARLLSVWPAPVGGGGGEGKPVAPENLEQEKEVKAAAIGTLETAQSRAFGLDQKDGLYDGGAGGNKGYVLTVPVVGEGGRAAAAITLLIEARSKAAVQSTLAMAEVLAGYVTLHAGRQEIKRMQQAGLSMELATRLIGAINAAPNFKGAALRLVNDLTRQLGADRAALGWVGGATGDTVTVVALSDAEKFDTRTKMVRQIADAMDECADQEQAVLFPPPATGADLLLSQAITTAHRELAGGDSRLSLCSVPLRDGDKTLGVLLVELKRVDAKTGGLDLRGVEVLQAAMDLVSPVLAVKWSDSRLLPRRALGDARKSLAWAVGTKHTVWKGAAVLALAVALFVTFFKIEHRVGATVELRPRVQRTVAAPFDGVVARIGEGVQPGRVVKAGDTIFEMDTRELLLQSDQADAKMQQGAKQLSTARRDGKVVEAQMAQAAIDKARAEKDLAEVRIRNARLTAPMDAVVIAGDLRDKVGASVKSGEELFLLAPLNDLMAVARVDERDIALVNVGAKGEIATKARPSEGFAVTVETIVPMAMPKEGKNLFEVRANLDKASDWMRPGMEGQVRIDAGERTLLWIGTRRVINQIRLWLW